MDVIDKIKACRNLTELDALRDEIHLAASYGEIDFKVVKRFFLEKKAELELLREKNWRVQK